MRPALFQDKEFNGRTYRIIFEMANHQHPAGSMIGVYTGDRFQDRVWILVANQSEHLHDEALFQMALVKAEAHSLST